MDCKSAAQALLGMNDILIITHRRPDGDTVGCGAALCEALRYVGKTAWILENVDLTQRYYEYFQGYVAPGEFQPKSVVTVDCASVGMLCQGAEQYKENIDLAIDHHGSHEYYAKEAWVDATAAACGEMILSLTLELCGCLPKKCGAPLYLAISTDTGCFQYSNTTANTLSAAAYLKGEGVDTYSINKIMFGTKSFARLCLESKLVAGLEMYSNGKVCLMTLTNEMMATSGATDNDIDDISGFPRAIEGVEIGVLVRELTENTSKCSLRSAGMVNSSEICQKLGGGGHPGAAGVSLDVPYTEMKRLILEAIGV